MEYKVMKPTQEQMFRQAQQRAADGDSVFMLMINHPTHPMTNKELEILIAKSPATWDRYKGYIGKLTD
jgi:hypothetical protein